MSTQQKVRQLRITVSDQLYDWLQGEANRRSQDISTVAESVLEQHAHHFDLTQTQTWQLCGSLRIAETQPECVVESDESEPPATNYAEHVDDVLYG